MGRHSPAGEARWCSRRADEGSVIAAPDLDQEVTAPAEQPHRPWLGPRAGTLLEDATGQGFDSRHNFSASEIGPQFSGRARLGPFGPREGRPQFTYLPGV